MDNEPGRPDQAVVKVVVYVIAGLLTVIVIGLLLWGATSIWEQVL
jgi:hypothetical protein